MTILQGTLKLHVHSVKFLADNLPPNLLPEDTVAVVAIVVKSANAKKQEILRTSPKIFVDASKIETMSPTQLDTTWNAKHEILVCQDIASVVVELRVGLEDGSEAIVGNLEFPAWRLVRGSIPFPGGGGGVDGHFKMQRSHNIRSLRQRSLVPPPVHISSAAGSGGSQCGVRGSVVESPGGNRRHGIVRAKSIHAACSCAAEIKISLWVERFDIRGNFCPHSIPP
uniref:C2 domain-containing protein n=2 Tax=Tetraselmis sp. GSL018 TaxID=582737 RepID=A0A061RHI8_9CHLO